MVSFPVVVPLDHGVGEDSRLSAITRIPPRPSARNVRYHATDGPVRNTVVWAFELCSAVLNIH